MSKVTVVGAGNVGATCANVLAHKDVVKEVVLLDITPKGDIKPATVISDIQDIVMELLLIDQDNNNISLK